MRFHNVVFTIFSAIYFQGNVASAIPINPQFEGSTVRGRTVPKIIEDIPADVRRREHSSIAVVGQVEPRSLRLMGRKSVKASGSATGTPINIEWIIIGSVVTAVILGLATLWGVHEFNKKRKEGGVSKFLDPPFNSADMVFRRILRQNIFPPSLTTQ